MTGRVLVAYASKMGSTAEIAEVIGREMRGQGIEVDVMRARDVRSVRPYEVVVLGSAIYFGRWRREAVQLLEREQSHLTGRHVQLFQSGLSVTGPGPWKDPTPDRVRDLAKAVQADVPVTFPGRLTRDSARGPLARVLARRASAGDFRDWNRIHSWARDLTAQIATQSAPDRLW